MFVSKYINIQNIYIEYFYTTYSTYMTNLYSEGKKLCLQQKLVYSRFSVDTNELNNDASEF